MRDIKFRGKRTDNGEWVHGYYIVNPTSNGGVVHIIYDEWEYSVDPETVGQYTGEKDKGDKEICNHDICEVTLLDGRKYTYKVGYAGAAYTLGNYYLHRVMDDVMGGLATIEVIGNVFDNPELLEGEHE